MAGEGSNFVQPAIPRFDGHHDHWSMLMENFLCSKEYWGLVENGITQYAEGTALTATQLKALEDKIMKDLKTNNSLPSHISSHFGDNPGEGHSKRHMRFDEKEVSRHN